jgi:hypothetical protein
MLSFIDVKVHGGIKREEGMLGAISGSSCRSDHQSEAVNDIIQVKLKCSKCYLLAVLRFALQICNFLQEGDNQAE